mmetsp:Transcript_45181/g.66252  ORF Transcript_45181/g.66252 Transcript_45181/m.66252 type:complete len:269 (-) Transcript_45181:951-1757(-)
MHRLALLVFAQDNMLDAQRAAAHRIVLLAGVFLIARSDRQVVNQPQCSILLGFLGVLSLKPLSNTLPDFGDIVLETARFFEFLAVRLALQGGASRQKDVLELSIDGVLVIRQPRCVVFVHHGPPCVSRKWAHGRFGVFRAVHAEELRRDNALYVAHLRVLASPTEQPRRLHPEVAVLLSVRIQNDCSVRPFHRLSRLFHSLLLLFGQQLLLRAVCFNTIHNRLEIALFQVLNSVSRAEQALEFAPKILDERLFGCIICIDHGCVHCCH